MQIFDISGMTLARNGGGEWKPSRLVGPAGSWSIWKAGQLVFYGAAVFHFNGRQIMDLEVLPVVGIG